MGPRLSGVIRTKPAAAFGWPRQALRFNDAKTHGPINAKFNQGVTLDVAVAVTGWLGSVWLVSTDANAECATGRVAPDPFGNWLNLPFGSAVTKTQPAVLVMEWNRHRGWIACAVVVQINGMAVSVDFVNVYPFNAMPFGIWLQHQPNVFDSVRRLSLVSNIGKDESAVGDSALGSEH
jgi:hypothetical protein